MARVACNDTTSACRAHRAWWRWQDVGGRRASVSPDGLSEDDRYFLQPAFVEHGS